MLRNRSKFSQSSHRNARKRNRRSTDQSSESSSSSDDSESSFLDYSSGETLFSDCSDSPFEDESVSPVIGRNLKSRRKRLNAKSKRSNRVIHNRNRNIRSKKKTPRTTDSQAPGPSKINNSSRRSRLENSNTRIAKRKYKDRRVDLESSSSAVCNTSSEEYEGPLFRIRKKRLRYAISNTSESDDSVIQTASSRRRNLLNSESSTSASDEITTNGVRSTRNGGPSLWSDANSDSMEFNSQETSAGESGSSINQNIRRRRRSVGYVGTSDSNGSFSSPFSNSLYSIDSEVANISSVPDSEASSLYNTAKSTSSNHGERNSKDQTSDSDSSDSDGEKCAICLKKFRNQLIGNPSNCDHNFCAPCLKKWSESSTTCPVDRSTFDSITIRSIINGPVVDKLKVENRNFGVFPPLDIDEVLLNDAINDAINCEICDSGDDEETLLLCDLCNLGYHMACLRPPLSAIPAGAWYCPQCVNFRIDPTQNVNEGLRFFPDSPMRPLYLLSSARRPNRIRTNNSRSRPNGPLPRGRGPTRGFRSQNLSNSRLHNLSNAIESVIANLNAETSSQNRRRRKQKNRPVTGSSAMQQLIMAENLETTSDAISRITRNVNQRMSSRNSGSIHRPRGPREVVDMVFPSFSLFGTDELDYFSDEQGEHDVEGEVAIMARVRSEYSARRLENRKNIVTSLNNYHDRSRPASAVNEITENASSVNLLDTILESQALWHSRNVEIKSKKDGTLEIKIKDEQNKKPDLTNTNHSSKEIPLFPNKGDGASDNKSYSNSNNRYSSLGNSSGGSSNSFTSSTSSFNSLNPSTRPGFSNLLGNNSSALDLSPFRGAAPIRFRMNPPRPMMRRQNYNSNSQRPPSSSPANLMNSVQSPKKSSTVGNADEDVDLYDDIETENVENEKSQEMFASLEPPPEPPALLIGSDSSSDDENNGLVIDDKAVHKSNIYDPNEPNEDSDTENTQDKNSNMVPGYLRSPSYGGLSEFGPHLPLPEPPAPALELRMELESVKDSDEEEEAECPNMTLYSNTSINLANNVQDIPIPDAAYPQDVLECIPIPTSALDSSVTKDDAATKTDSELYSPTDKNDSETSSIAEVQITSPEKIPPKRRDSFEIRSISSRDSSRERGDRSSTEGSDRSNSYEKVGKRSSRRRSKDNVRRRRRNVNNVSAIDLVQRDKPSKKIDLTEVDSNDEKNQTQSDDESVDDSKTATEETNDGCNVSEVSVGKDGEDEAEKSDDEKKADDKSVTDAASVKSANEDYKTASEDEDNESEKVTANETDKEKTAEGSVVDTSLEAENVDTVADNDDANATTNDVNASGNYLLPSEDLDPVSDVEYNDFSECQRTLSNRDKRKKRKKTRRRDSSTDNKTAAEAKELEEGEIEEEKSKRKYSSQKKKDRSETPERSPDRRLKKKRDRKEKTNGKENKETGAGGKATGGAGGAAGEDLQWKKLSKNTKERNYRDGKTKPNDKLDKAKDREIKGRKEKRKEIERYDVRKIVSDKPRPVRDEFGRDVSVNRSRSRTRSRSVSYSGRRRSKGTTRRSFSQDDRWIDWSPVWNQQRRSRSRTRRSKSRSRNRSRLSGDRYRNRSKNRDRDREYDTREPRKRKRSISSEIDKYTPPMAELKKRRRSQDRSRKSGSYTGAPIRPSGRERDIPSEYYYERSRSWSRSLSYASLTPDQEQYVRYSRSPSIIEPPTRIPIVSPNRGHDMITPNQQNLTVIVPNVDLSKKKHKKKKESKKKKKKQPSKEVFTSGDNIVVSVNFDDNQKIISAKSSKRKHDEEKGRKKKKDETRKKRKQTLQVSEEVLNAKPVAVIDLNSSPCKEMSPTEVISLTDSGDDEVNVIENIIPADRRVASSQDDANKTPTERRAYVMTQSGPKTPPEPPIKFTVNSTAPSRPLPTNPIFEQDEIDGEDAMHYNKGPNTPPEPANQTRRSISPSTTMYDPFEPTKSRSQSPENAEYDERKDTATGTAAEERRPVIDMFSEDNDKSSAENQSGGVCAEKSKPQEDVAKENVTATPTKASASEDSALSTNTKSPAKDASAADSANETAQANGVNTLVLDLSSLGDDFVPKSTIPLVKTSQGKYEFQSGKAPDKPITVVISQQSQPAKPQPQQVMVTPTRQVPTKPVEPMKQPVFPDLLSWKLPPPLSQANFSTPPPTSSSLPLGSLVTPSKSAPGLLAQNGDQDENSFEVDDSPYSPAGSEGDDLFEPPPLNASTSSPNKQRPSPMPAVNSYKSRVDALFSSSPIKKVPPRSNVPPHISKPVSAIKGTKKILKPPPPIPSSKKDPGIRADEEQLKILDDVPNSAVEMMVKEKFLKKLHRQERVVEEVKVVLKPHYAKKHITKEEYKDILRKAVPKICHNKSGDINPSKIQGLVQAYVKKIRHAKKKPTMGAGAPLFPPVKTGKTMKPWYIEWCGEK